MCKPFSLIKTGMETNATAVQSARLLGAAAPGLGSARCPGTRSTRSTHTAAVCAIFISAGWRQLPCGAGVDLDPRASNRNPKGEPDGHPSASPARQGGHRSENCVAMPVHPRAQASEAVLVSENYLLNEASSHGKSVSIHLGT